MELIIVRHGDPNYAIDSLTPRGKQEAKLLAKKLTKMDIKAFYCSPLGRAKKTASYTLKKLCRKAEFLPWLEEFKGSVTEAGGKNNCCWDRLPSAWCDNDIHYTEKWYNSPLYENTNVKEEYKRVCDGLDKLLAKHGYEHTGRLFKVTDSNHDKIVLFCHFGVECVLLSHILGISPMILWHNAVAPPASVTTLVTEEREKGTAIFRMTCFGDTGHLYAGNQAPSFMARFCECFEDDTRH